MTDVLVRPMTGGSRRAPKVRTGGQGGGVHTHSVSKAEATVLIPGYVAQHSSGKLVIRDNRENADVHGVIPALTELLGDEHLAKVEFSDSTMRARGAPLFDLVMVDDTYYLAPVDVSFELATVEKAMATEKRYTFGVVYQATNKESDPELDTHDEFALADDLQKAQIEYVRKGNRNIYLQHGGAADVIGEVVDIVTWPFEVEVEFEKPGKVEKAVETRTIPANSIWMGVVWSEEAWPAVKSGEIGGLSMGGWAKRLKR